MSGVFSYCPRRPGLADQDSGPLRAVLLARSGARFVLLSLSLHWLCGLPGFSFHRTFLPLGLAALYATALLLAPGRRLQPLRLSGAPARRWCPTADGCSVTGLLAGSRLSPAGSAGRRPREENLLARPAAPTPGAASGDLPAGSHDAYGGSSAPLGPYGWRLQLHGTTRRPSLSGRRAC